MVFLVLARLRRKSRWLLAKAEEICVGFLVCSFSVVLLLELHSLFCRRQDVSACEEGSLGSETQHQAFTLEVTQSGQGDAEPCSSNLIDF